MYGCLALYLRCLCKRRSVISCPAVYDTGAIDMVYVGSVAADNQTPQPSGSTFEWTVHCHSCSEAAKFSSKTCTCGPVVTGDSRSKCPLWTSLRVGKAFRTYLEWTGHPVFVIGAPVVSKRWGLCVLGTADGLIAFVKDDAGASPSLVAFGDGGGAASGGSASSAER